MPGAHGQDRAVSLPGDSPAADTGATGLREVTGAYFAEVPVGSIAPNARQPRRTFDEEALDELALDAGGEAV